MPRKLTPEEKKKMSLRNVGKKHSVRAALEMLEPGEILHITKEEFNWKRKTPAVFFKDIENGGEKKFEILAEKSGRGWVVTRIS